MGKRNADNDLQNDSPHKMAKHDIELSPSIVNDFVLTKEIVNGQILTDLKTKKWRVGKPIGKGSFGELFLASDDINKPVSNVNAKYVVKIEPHSNGPLFVEIHCLINIGKSTPENPLPPGMPEFIASGSHYFNNRKYRFLILPRYKCDLHSIIKDRRIDTKNLLIIACQILDVLEHIHDKGYAHSDIKAENLMIGTCTYRKKRQIQSSLSTDSGRDSNDDEDYDQQDEETEKNYHNDNYDDEDDIESMDENSDSDFELDSGYKTPVTTTKGRLRNDKKLQIVEFSGSNPVRSCRMERKYSTYQDMLNSHYLRPSRKVNYVENDDDDLKLQEQNKDSKEEVDDDDNDAEWLSMACHRTRKQLTQEKYLHNKLIDKNNDDVDDDDDDDDNEGKTITEDRIFLIDYGLASKFINSSGLHHPFCMDQRRAHDGTIEFTSRDAHYGAHSRRSDLECLGYNLIYWCQGALPWKDEKLMQQPEQVHRMKEYFMADIQNVYKSIYGEPAPKFIYEFLEYVSNLAYHDRPNYSYCRQIFINELKTICKITTNNQQPDMKINLNELKKKPLRKLQNGMVNNNVKIKDVKEMMKLHQMVEPFKEKNGTSRISPKNLRSKSEKIPDKQRSKFSWTDVLSTDPDQIARQRAEKEIERYICDTTPITTRYKGKPTYAIIAVQNRMKLKEKLLDHTVDGVTDEDRIDGYTPAMMDVWRKRKSSLVPASQPVPPPQHCDRINVNNKTNKKYSLSQHHVSTHNNINQLTSSIKQSSTIQSSTSASKQYKIKKILQRRKSGLRKNVRQTQKFVSFYEQQTNKKRRNGNSEFTPTDESSCGSVMSSTDDSTGATTATIAPSRVRIVPQRNRKRYHTNADLMLSPSDDDSRDTTDYTPISKPLKKPRRKNKVLKKKLPNGKANKKASIREETKNQRLNLRAFTRG